MYDAIVIGGGPAGAVASLRLARLAWRTALIERSPIGGDKACGCCLSARAMTTLDRLGLGETVRSLAGDATKHLRVHAPGAPALSTPLGSRSTHGGLVTPRSRLDQALRDAAAAEGVEVCQRATAKVVQAARDAATVSVRFCGNARQFRTRLVVGADGLGSAVARRAGLSDGATVGRQYGFALTRHVSAQTSHAELVSANTIEMFLLDVGYIGVVRIDAANLHCAAMIRSDGRQVSPADALDRAAVSHPAFAALHIPDCANGSTDSDRRIIGAGPMPVRRQRVARGRIVLVGDAAGYAEPFTGEGMTWAIESADMLGTIAQQTNPDGWTDACAEQYNALWRQRIGARLWRCGIVGGMLRHTRTRAAGLSFLRRCPMITNFLVRRMTAA